MKKAPNRENKFQGSSKGGRSPTLAPLWAPVETKYHISMVLRYYEQSANIFPNPTVQRCGVFVQQNTTYIAGSLSYLQFKIQTPFCLIHKI